MAALIKPGDTAIAASIMGTNSSVAMLQALQDKGAEFSLTSEAGFIPTAGASGDLFLDLVGYFDPRPREGATAVVHSTPDGEQVSIRAPVRGRRACGGAGVYAGAFRSAPP